MTLHAPFASKAILTDEPRSWEEIIAEREAVRWAEIAKRNALTPAQAKAADYRNGDLVHVDDGDTDPYLTRRF